MSGFLMPFLVAVAAGIAVEIIKILLNRTMRGSK